MVTVAWGEGVNVCLPVSLPLNRTLIACPNTRVIMLGGVPGTPLSLFMPLPHYPPPTKHIFRILLRDCLMVRPIELSPKLCNGTHLLAEIGLLNNELE